MRRIVAPILFPSPSNFLVLRAFQAWGLGCLVFLGACITDPPLEEYVLADAALSAAKAIQADRFAPAYWIRAQKSYDSAEANFSERNFDEAADEFRQAREHAEQAENAARLNRARSGSGPP